MKALPHRSSNYAETVCCAGIGHDAKWRRLYPVQFRILDDEQKFKRWQWINYSFTTTRNDTRMESQKVIPETIKPRGLLKPKERVSILNMIMRNTLEDANHRNESLALLRPNKINFSWTPKTDKELSDESRKHAVLAQQLSLIDKKEAPPLTPCPYRFTVRWQDDTEKIHSHTCDDWETSTAFFRRKKSEGSDSAALNSLKETYEVNYMQSGLALAFSTHSRRNVTYGTPNQWLLVGIIRIDESKQDDLFSES